jgi:hypothetical protein
LAESTGGHSPGFSYTIPVAEHISQQILCFFFGGGNPALAERIWQKHDTLSETFTVLYSFLYSDADVSPKTFAESDMMCRADEE